MVSLQDCLSNKHDKWAPTKGPQRCDVCGHGGTALVKATLIAPPAILLVRLERAPSIRGQAVSFPLEGLDLAGFVKEPAAEKLLYDLVAAWCVVGPVVSWLGFTMFLPWISPLAPPCVPTYVYAVPTLAQVISWLAPGVSS